ncbi:MAG: NAD(P)-dependent oxidoreductase [Thermoprotei archaeon]|nr:MAG: NAD(P)-dependent oxidoreductase [Thermoprotei archaeon]
MRIGIVGLGLMGTALARCLASRGFELVVYNRTLSRAENLCRELGCVVATTPRGVAEACRAVILFVSDDEAVHQVALGRGGVAEAPGRVTVINMSTITPMESLRLYEGLQRRGKAYLEAPVYGSVDAAEGCRLLTMAAGPREVFEDAKGVLEAFSSELMYLGDVPRASVLKLALNNIGLALPAILGESLALLKAWGVEIEILRSVARKLWFGEAVERYWDRALGEAGSVRFRLALAAKDMHYVARALRERGVPAHVSSAIADLYTAAAASGYGDKDYPVAVQHLLRLAGGGSRAGL